MYVCRVNIKGQIFEKTYRTKLTLEFDVSTHAIFKTTYNELRLTTILFQLPIHPPSRKKLVVASSTVGMGYDLSAVLISSAAL